jgi:hypothetical protein
MHALSGDSVKLAGGNSRSDANPQCFQSLGDNFAGDAHAFDLFGRFELDPLFFTKPHVAA